MTGTPAYQGPAEHIIDVAGTMVHCYPGAGDHRDEATIRSFGEEWEKFNTFDEDEIRLAGDEYFDIVPDDLLGPNVVAMDLGCGSGRWTRYLSTKVGHIDSIDPSEAVLHAARTHGDLRNVRWTRAGVDNIPFPDGTFDLIICLGVLHHVPDTEGAIGKAAKKLRPGGHMLLYLYYALDGRGGAYRMLFQLSDLFRRVIHRLPGAAKRAVCDVIAIGVYWPLRSMARIARWITGPDGGWKRLPLSHYHDKSMQVLRNDALDRFGTPLEQRFTKDRMGEMMLKAGLNEIRFSDRSPYWHAIARRG